MALTKTFLGFLSSTADLSSYSLGNASPASDGLLVICPLVRAGSSVSISGVTIGGASASIPVDTGSLQNPACVATLEVTAGTYAIVVNLSAGAVRCGANCWLLTGYNSATPYATGQNGSASSVTSRMITMDYPTGGGLGLYSGIHANTNASSWSAASAEHDTTVEALVKMAGAWRSASGAGQAETLSWTGSVMGTLVGAVWEPAPPSAANRRRRSLICGAA